MAFANVYVERDRVERRTRLMTVLAQDPLVRGPEGVLRAVVPVPVSRLEPGPRSSRFHVVNYDASSGFLSPPVDLTGPAGGPDGPVDRFAELSDAELLSDPAFHAQHVYAVAARTLARFEFALGRRLSWGFPAHQLYLVPHAFAEANAFYSSEDRALLFGYFLGPNDSTIWTCLSHDVVAHEATHAILDGLRGRFLEPGLPDQSAFHEALADIVALLSVLSLPTVVEALLGAANRSGRITAASVSAERLLSGPLTSVAEQLGSVLVQGKGPLRQSGMLVPGTGWQTDLAFEEPHRRGEVLVAIVLDVLVRMWTGRLEELIASGELSRVRAAEEGAKAADHLLTMVIRSIDYLPPVEFEFADFFDAIIISDGEVAPDDPRRYREALQAAFAAFGIERPEGGRTIDLTDPAWAPRYHGMNFAAMRTDPDEVFRFLWENAEQLEVNTGFATHVEAVRPAIRVGPDGLVLHEAVADYVQVLDLTFGEFVELAPTWPVRGEPVPVDSAALESIDAATTVRLFGGGTLILDQFGRAKYHIRKPLDDASRQARRLGFLARSSQLDDAGRLGFSTGGAPGQEIAELHVPSGRAGEDW